MNDSIYVGSTAQKTLAVRMAQHRCVSKSENLNKHLSIHDGMKSIGSEHFIITLHHLFPCNSKDELEAEEYKVMHLYAEEQVTLYNKVVSKYGFKHTDETKLKMSVAFTGKKHTDEAKARMSVAQKGKQTSAETKLKISIAQIGKQLSAETKLKISIAQIGKLVSAETKAKMSVAQTGAKHNRFSHGSVIHRANKNMWIFQWSLANIKICKSFACSRYGFWQAKLMAEDFRRTIYPDWKSEEEAAMIELMNIDMD